MLHFYTLKTFQVVQRIKERNKQNANQEENRIAHLSQLWREDIFLCVEELENVISVKLVLFEDTTLKDNKVSLSKKKIIIIKSERKEKKSMKR